MKIYHEDLYNDDSTVEFQKSLFLNPEGLDYWLRKMERDGIPYKGKFREKLLSFYKVPSAMAAEGETIKIDTAKLKVLSSDLELAKAGLLKNFDLMGFKIIPQDETLKINTKHYLRARLHKGYFLAKSLEAIMPKEEAISYYQKITDEQTRETGTNNHPQKAADYLFRNEKHTGAFIGAFNYAECELDAGRIAKKIKKCKWCEVLKEVNDPDYAYAVACHYDFEATKVENPAFTLTRTGTLIQGHSCCDFVWHDTRLDAALVHPGKELWDELT